MGAEGEGLWRGRDQVVGEEEADPAILVHRDRHRVARARLDDQRHRPARLIDACITQLKAQGPSKTYNESKEDLRGVQRFACAVWGWGVWVLGLGFWIWVLWFGVWG